MKQRIYEFFIYAGLTAAISVTSTAGVSAFLTLFRYIFSDLEVWTTIIVLFFPPVLIFFVPLYAGIADGNWTTLYFLGCTLLGVLFIGAILQLVEQKEKALLVQQKENVLVPRRFPMLHGIFLSVIVWLCWNIYYFITVGSLFFLHALGENIADARDLPVLFYLGPLAISVNSTIGTVLAIKMYIQAVEIPKRTFGVFLLGFCLLDAILAYYYTAKHGFDADFFFWSIHVFRVLAVLIITFDDKK